MLEHDSQFHLHVNLVAEKYFEMSPPAFRKHLKSGALPKNFVSSIEQNLVPTRALANLFDNLKQQSDKNIMTSKTEYTKNSTSSFKDMNLMGRWMLASSLMHQYGTALIPYSIVAADFLGWKAEKTAMAKYNDGTVARLNLVTIQNNVGRKQPVFVAVQDLADFILQNRNVAILN
jgi:hypothetical protein